MLARMVPEAVASPVKRIKSGIAIFVRMKIEVAFTVSTEQPQPYWPLKLPYQLGAVPEHSFARST